MPGLASKTTLPVLLLFLSGCATQPPGLTLNDGAPHAQAQAGTAQHGKPNDDKEAPRFVLGPGDSIAVKVWRNDELTATATVDPDGKVALPLVGELVVDGASPADVAQTLTKKFSQYLVDPRVSVNVNSLVSRKVYILGEVQSPGSFALDPRMSLMEVVALAGGFTESASKRRVLLARPSEGAVRVSVLNLNPKSAAFSLGFLLPLRNRDMIYVLPSRITSVERFLRHFESIIRPFSTLAGAVVLGDDASQVLSGSDSATERRTGVAIEP
jgi:polysaccharide biosynthesis/export protein